MRIYGGFSERLYGFILRRAVLVTPQQLQEIIDEIESLYRAERYADAATLIEKFHKSELQNATKLEVAFYCNLACLLVDVADAAKHQIKSSDPLFDRFEKLLEVVVGFFGANLPKIQNVYDKGAGNYNYANAISTLLDYKRRVNPKHLKPEMGTLLNLARKQFLKAIKSSPRNPLEVKTNLAHALCKGSRVIEAIQLYDEVLREDPNLFNALYSRSLDLEYLNELTSSYSVKMLYEIAAGYRRASLIKGILPSMQQLAASQYQKVVQAMNRAGATEESMEREISANQNEFDEHSDSRKYFLENGLSLSEHGIYCHCVGADRDNLSILKTSGEIGGKFVPRHEYILNQLKAEFAQARLSYYRAAIETDEFYRAHDYEMCLSDLKGNERLDGRSEDLKTSFRQCFGILDRIALGVCELFDLPVAKGEKIYFEKFWQGRQQSPEEIQRWEMINLVEDNSSLFALYYQSVDLNDHEGEWKSYKKWRNALEHGFFILHEGKAPISSYGALESKFPITAMKFDDFESRTKDLLGFTRSAVFNYAFCVRAEGERVFSSQKGGKRIGIEKKNFN